MLIAYQSTVGQFLPICYFVYCSLLDFYYDENELCIFLRAVLNKSWRQHPTKRRQYRHLSHIPKTIQVIRIRYEGHCWRSKDELISDILLWNSSHGRAKARRLTRTCIQQLCVDAACSLENLLEAMDGRNGWRERVREIRAGSATWWW